jgi:hypothetical protein
VHRTLEDIVIGATKTLRIQWPGGKLFESKVFDTVLPKGCNAGTCTKFPRNNEDGFPRMIFVVQPESHRLFERKGNDLLYSCKNVNPPQVVYRGVTLKI